MQQPEGKPLTTPVAILWGAVILSIAIVAARFVPGYQIAGEWRINTASGAVEFCHNAAIPGNNTTVRVVCGLEYACLLAFVLSSVRVDIAPQPRRDGRSARIVRRGRSYGRVGS